MKPVWNWCRGDVRSAYMTHLCFLLTAAFAREVFAAMQQNRHNVFATISPKSCLNKQNKLLNSYFICCACCCHCDNCSAANDLATTHISLLFLLNWLLSLFEVASHFDPAARFVSDSTGMFRCVCVCGACSDFAFYARVSGFKLLMIDDDFGGSCIRFSRIVCIDCLFISLLWLKHLSVCCHCPSMDPTHFWCEPCERIQFSS